MQNLKEPKPKKPKKIEPVQEYRESEGVIVPDEELSDPNGQPAPSLSVKDLLTLTRSAKVSGNWETVIDAHGEYLKQHDQPTDARQYVKQHLQHVYKWATD